jgi:hypothetical protein
VGCVIVRATSVLTLQIVHSLQTVSNQPVTCLQMMIEQTQCARIAQYVVKANISQQFAARTRMRNVASAQHVVKASSSK